MTGGPKGGRPWCTGTNTNRAHDINILTKVVSYRKEHDTKGLELRIRSPLKTMRYTAPSGS